jgi:hypothetical protein
MPVNRPQIRERVLLIELVKLLVFYDELPGAPSHCAVVYVDCQYEDVMADAGGVCVANAGL